MKPTKKTAKLKQAAFNLRGVDPQLKRAFKARCAEEGVPMKDKLQQLIHNYTKGEQPCSSDEIPSDNCSTSTTSPAASKSPAPTG